MKKVMTKELNPVRADGTGSDRILNWAFSNLDGSAGKIPVEVADLFNDKCPTNEKDVNIWEVAYKIKAVYDHRRALNLEPMPMVAYPDMKPDESCPPKFKKALEGVRSNMMKALDEEIYTSAALGFIKRVD